ncbi:hypothetical protein [Massilia sp. DWR3-1-1]|uniref:hypothetical protein n=1 Tax=Massilia sp. DWR3-1-1 TaxID=2804559 RepID=UPI003CF5430A
MLKTYSAPLCTLLCAVLLTACGGGGSSSSASSAPETVSPAVTFSPAKLSATFVAGTAAPLNVTATATRPADFNGVSTVYVFIVDDTGVIQSNPAITQTSNTQYSARLTTLTTLAAGTRTGNFSLRLCKDAACSAQFPGSPVALPYELVITAKP